MFLNVYTMVYNFYWCVITWFYEFIFCRRIRRLKWPSALCHIKTIIYLCFLFFEKKNITLFLLLINIYDVFTISDESSKLKQYIFTHKKLENIYPLVCFWNCLSIAPWQLLPTTAYPQQLLQTELGLKTADGPWEPVRQN